jgi:hypothetical protein
MFQSCSAAFSASLYLPVSIKRELCSKYISIVRRVFSAFGAVLLLGDNHQYE